MNKFFRIAAIFLTLMSACQKKANNAAAPVDLAKIEQLKKLLAEQTSELETPVGGTTPSTETVDPTKLVSLRTYPQTITLLEGLSTTFTVYAKQANAVERSISTGLTFTQSQVGIATLGTSSENSQWSVKALVPGRTVVTITLGEMTSTLTVIVNAKELVSVEIFPKSVSIGSPSRFTLRALYSNNTQEDVTSGVIWESIDPTYLQSNAQSSATGVYTGAKVGLSGLRARYGAITVISRIDIQMPRIVKIEVSAETDTFLLGSNEIPITALATFVGGNTFDIANSVTWSVEDSSILTVSSDGLMEALFPGESFIKATYGDISGQSSFLVTSENFASFRITPATTTTPKGLAAVYKLYGVRADHSEREITSYTRWTVDDVTTAYSGTTLKPKQPGKIYGVEKGTTTVRARYGLTVITAEVVVTDPIVLALNMTGEKLDGVCGVDEPKLKVDGELSDGTIRDMTGVVIYTITPASLGLMHTDVTKAGLMATKEPGQGTVMASYLEPSTSTILTAVKNLDVKNPVKLNIGITALTTSVPYGTQLYLTSSQLMSCGFGESFTTTSTWVTNNSASVVNTVINASGSKGTLSTLDMDDPPTTANKKINVTASKGTLSNQIEITVRPKEITKVVTALIDPLQDTLDVNTSIQVVSTSTFSNLDVVTLPDPINYPGYTVEYAMLDCTAPLGQSCGSINDTTGVFTAGTREGYVRIYSIVTPPPGSGLLPIESAKTFLTIQSKCDPALNGVRAGLYCVRLGARGESCTQTCAAIVNGNGSGTYNEATNTVFGKGALDNDMCAAALQAPVYDKGLQVGNHNASAGVGCSVVYNPTGNYETSVWENSTNTTAGAFSTRYKRICACTEPP